MHGIRSTVALLAPGALMALLAVPLGARDESITYPETEAGRCVAAYFQAFDADEVAMRAFLRRYVAPADLERRPLEARLEVWREMREELGRVTPLHITASAEDFVEVLVRGESRAGARIRLLFRAEAPHTLQGIRVEDAEEGDEQGAGSASAEPAGPPPDDARIVASLAAEVDSLSRAGAFSGAVLLDKDGSALFSRATGMESREAKRPNRVETRFDLGSINKVFTHVAVLQLEQQGKLGLDDTIDRYLPDYPDANGRRITVQMLVEHRGGVPDVLEHPELWEDPAKVRTVADWYRLIRDAELRFEPGTRQEYSNGGYVLLGAIVERVSGEDYYRYVRDHIFVPAGMASTESDLLEDRREGTATPYSRRISETSRGADRQPVANPKRLGRGSPAGGGYSTVGDLVRFARALRQGKLLDAEHRDRLIGANARLGIAGGSPGVNALLEVQGPYTLAVLANVDPPAAERFARTTGRMLARATGDDGSRHERRVGGGAH